MDKDCRRSGPRGLPCIRRPVDQPMPSPGPNLPLPRPAAGFAQRRWPGWLVLPALLALGAGAWLLVDRLLVDRRPIVVGILHSQTGPMAASANPSGRLSPTQARDVAQSLSAAAVPLVRSLMFIEKFRHDLDARFDALS